MKRRAAIVGIAVLAATAGRVMAQSGKIPRVGVLHAGSSKESATIQREPFERGLRELGWVPGSTVLIDYRYAEGNTSRLSVLAAELVRSKVDVMVARGNAAIDAARWTSATIPIVMSAGSDPVAEGIVQNLSRPGGNITGLALLTFELDGKRLELLKETFPGIGRVALIANPENEPRGYKGRIADLRADARALKVDLELFEVSQAAELASAFAAISRGRFDGLLVRAEPRLMDQQRHEIAAMAAKLRLPAMYWWRFYAEAGGLMSYGESIPGFHHRSAAYVSRILKGANPADLAIERPSKFELTINLKAAKALGVEIPKAMLFRADELIQ
jgi:putative ABC transport system substrate-binding protein